MDYAKRFLQIDVKVRTSGVCSTIWTKRRSFADTRESDLSNVHFSIYHVLYLIHSKWEHLVRLNLYHKLVKLWHESIIRPGRRVFIKKQGIIVGILYCICFVNTNTEKCKNTNCSPFFVSEVGQPLAREHHLTIVHYEPGIFWWFVLNLYFKYKYREIQNIISISIRSWSNSGTRASDTTANCSLRSGVLLVFCVIVPVSEIQICV